MDNLNIIRCEDEPIHIPGLIQPIGYFFAIDYSKHTIEYVSQNSSELFGVSAQNIIDKNILDLFEDMDVILEQFLTQSNQERKIYFGICAKDSLKKFDLFISKYYKKYILCEFIPQRSSIENIDEQYEKTVENLISKAYDIQSLFQEVTNNIQQLTHYDRVMLYKFDPDFNGKVIAESKIDSLESYMNLHYPSSDIPAQARDLYLKNKTRVISNVNYTAQGIVSYNVEPVDMSLGFLRSVSPIHLEYMRNMGVAASMTISVVIDNKLWGLIACHHGNEFMPEMKIIQTCEKIANMISYLIKIFEEKEYESNQNKFLGTIDTIASVMKQNIQTKDIYDFIGENIQMFKPLFDANGIIFFHDKNISYEGIFLEKHQLQIFVDAIDTLEFQQSFETLSLKEHQESLDERILKECSGVIALRLNTSKESLLIWTKVEQVQTVNWGGNPNETDTKMTLTPRKSFEKFAQVVTFRSVPWGDLIENKLQIILEKLEYVFELSSTSSIVDQQKNIILSLEEEKLKNQSQLIEMLVSMIEQRDAYTAGHTQRVADYCEMIGKELNISTHKIDLLIHASKLHDIGKISIPDSLLLKPGRLNQNEFHLIKQHLNVGYEILSKIDYYKQIAEIMRYHHEKYDGSGYPEGKKGDEISIESHIMVVADALDAMTSNRIYQKRKSLKEAIEEIKFYSGKWYHPKVVESLLKLYDEGKILLVDTHQLPLTKMEEERFSYFFKDQLTNLYNESYLWMVMNNQIPSISAKYYVIVELKEMSYYNKVHGWHSGNLLIKNIAEYIIKTAQQNLIFRIFGDDFVIVFETQKEFESLLKNWNEIKIGNVYTVAKDVDKNYLMNKIETL